MSTAAEMPVGAWISLGIIAAGCIYAVISYASNQRAQRNALRDVLRSIDRSKGRTP